MAADGMLGLTVQLESGKELAVSDLFPYLADLNRGTQLVVSASGACDPAMGDVKERLSPFRHQLFCMRGTIAANASDIVIAPQNVTLFNVGVGGDAAGSGFGTGVLTRAETNAQEKGGLVQQNQSYVTVGYWVQMGKPFWKASAAPATVALLDDRHFPKWLRDKDTAYDQAGLEALFDSVAASSWKAGPNAACEYDLGPLSLWAQGSGVGPASNGSKGLPGQFWYMAVPAVTGGTNSGKELNLVLRNERTLTIDNDAANNTVQGAVAFIGRVVNVGFPICAVPGTGDVRAMVREEMITTLRAMGLSTEQIAAAIATAAVKAKGG